MTPKPTKTAAEPRLFKLLSHPLRQRILHELHGRVASPRQLADELDEPLGNVAYHVKILANNDALELVRTEPARGALEHFYQATERAYLDDQQWGKLPLSARRALAQLTQQEIWEHSAKAALEGGFDDEKAHISWVPLELDEEAYDELAERLGEIVDRAMELHAESMQRLAKLSAEERQAHFTELAILHFHRPTGEGAAGEADGRKGAMKRRRSSRRRQKTAER